MGHHLTKDNEFKSDKYKNLAVGFFCLKFSDPKARTAIRLYARITNDEELASDLLVACETAEGKAADGRILP